MFEKQVEQKLSLISCNSYADYYVLTHKKHKREMYFKVGDKKVIEFVKSKFSGRKKQIIYKALKLGLLQPFLKKVKLPYRFDLILVANQMKGFSFKEDKVYSFPISYGIQEFITEKDVQLVMSQHGFAPSINMLSGPNPNPTKMKRRIRYGNQIGGHYSVEDLCKPYDGPLEPVIDKLLEFYYEFGELIHGDFSMEQVVEKDGKIMFIDWSLRKGDPMEDIHHMFRYQKDYEDSADYKMIVKKLVLSRLRK